MLSWTFLAANIRERGEALAIAYVDVGARTEQQAGTDVVAGVAGEHKGRMAVAVLGIHRHARYQQQPQRL